MADLVLPTDTPGLHTGRWQVQRLVDMPIALYLVGSAYDGPDNESVLCRSVDEVDRVFGTTLRYRFQLVEGQTYATLPLPCATNGLISTSLPLEGVRVLQRRMLVFRPSRVSGPCVVEYVLYPDVEGYLPAAARFLFRLGVPEVVCCRLPGLVARADWEGWTFSSRFSGQRYNGCTARILDGVIRFVGLDGETRTLAVEKPYGDFFRWLESGSDFPLVVRPPSYPVESVPDTPELTLSGGLAAAYTQESLVEWAGLFHPTWPGVIVPAGGVGEEAAIAIYAMRAYAPVPLLFSFHLAGRNWLEPLREAAPVVFGDRSMVGGELLQERCIAGEGTVFLRLIGLRDYARIATPQTDCPPLPQSWSADRSVTIDRTEPYRWEVDGAVDTSGGWRFTSGSGSIRLTYPVPFRHLRLRHQLSVSGRSDVLPRVARYGLIDWWGVVFQWGPFCAGWCWVQLDSPNRPGVITEGYALVMYRDGGPVQLVFPDAAPSAGRVYLDISRNGSVFTVQVLDAITGSPITSQVGIDFGNVPIDGSYEIRWQESTRGSTGPTSDGLTVSRIVSELLTGGSMSVEVSTPVLDLRYFGGARIELVPDPSVSGGIRVAARWSDEPFDAGGTYPLWGIDDGTTRARYWQFRVTAPASLVVERIRVVPEERSGG
jgi:hypothetical protein